MQNVLARDLMPVCGSFHLLSWQDSLAVMKHNQPAFEDNTCTDYA